MVLTHLPLYVGTPVSPSIPGAQASPAIGCYFDDPVQEVFGIASRDWQNFYRLKVKLAAVSEESW